MKMAAAAHPVDHDPSPTAKPVAAIKWHYLELEAGGGHYTVKSMVFVVTFAFVDSKHIDGGESGQLLFDLHRGINRSTTAEVLSTTSLFMHIFLNAALCHLS